MQFIFGSDKNNGYGVLFADDQNEAARVRELIKININANIDAYGFMTFGANSNQPLFFSAKKDTSYNREAYYIHGIYQKAVKGYYQSKNFEENLLAMFAEQGTIDALRQGEMPGAIGGVDIELYAKGSDNIPMSAQAATEILARIYNGESIIIAVSDELYSNEYARILMYKLFRYMPPTLKKSCSFITGVPDAESFRVRILPLSLAKNASGVRIPLNDSAYEGAVIPEFTGIVSHLVGAMRDSAEEVGKLFAEYDIFCNGFGSNYKPKQFVEFFRAYVKNDADLCEKLLDEYLITLENPTSKDIPNFVLQNLSGHFDGFKPFSIGSVDEMIDHQSLLKKNTLGIKKLCAMCPESAFVAIRDIFVEFFKVQKLDDALIGKLKNSFKPLEDSSAAFYKVEFYRAFNAMASAVQNRIAEIEALKNDVEKTVADMMQRPNVPHEHITDDRLANARAWLVDGCGKILEDAKAKGYDMAPYIKSMAGVYLKKHNETYPPKIERPTGVTIEEKMRVLGAYREALNTPKSPDTVVALSNVCKLFANDKHTLKNAVEQYVLYAKPDENSPHLNIVDDICRMHGGDFIIQVALVVGKIDLVTSVKFMAAYLPLNAVMIELIKFVFGENCEAYDNLELEVALACTNAVSNIVRLRLKGIENMPEALSDSITNRIAGIDTRNCGKNTKAFAEMLSKVWKNYCSHKSDIPVVIGKSAPIAPIVVGVAIVAVLVAIVVVKFGLFGGGAPKDTDVVGGTDTPAVSDVISGADSESESDTTDISTDTKKEPENLFGGDDSGISTDTDTDRGTDTEALDSVPESDANDETAEESTEESTDAPESTSAPDTGAEKAP